MIATADQTERSTEEVVDEMHRTTRALSSLVDELKVLVKRELEELPRADQ